MQNRLWKKGLVLGIIMLFIGAGVTPNITRIVSADDVPIYEFLTYANFGSDNSCYISGQGVGGYGDKLYVATSGRYCYIYRVSIPDGTDPDTHPDNPEALGPMAPRTLELVESYNIYNDIGSICQSYSEFYIDEDYIYYGASTGGIHYWTKNADGTFGTYQGKIVDVVQYAETLAYDDITNTWYAGHYSRKIYSFGTGDTAWQYEFTYPTYEGSHHDGLEFVNGYLWISDMTSNWIGQWKKNPDGTWEELARFYYDNPVEDDVEGMGFGPLGHLWATGWNRLYEIGGKELGTVIKGIQLSMTLDKDDYYPDEMITITAEVTDSDGNSLYPIGDKTTVKIDGNEVSIEKRYYWFNTIPPDWILFILKVRAPSDSGEHTIEVHVETDLGSADASSNFNVLELLEPFTFVHITDVHMGSTTNMLVESDTAGSTVSYYVPVTAEQILSAAIDEIKEDIKPDFILDTGDIVNVGGGPGGSQLYINYNSALDDLIVYTVPGNHDRYTWLIGGNDLTNYTNNLGPEARPENCNHFIPPNNYTFEYGGYLFVGLDSGWDELPPCDICLPPEGSGLTNSQITALYGLSPTKRKIIFMHHPAINDGCWPNPCNGCIVNNRQQFINYCRDSSNNVALVLTGHTHQEKVFSADGDPWNGNWNKPSWPLFIQTPSLGKPTWEEEEMICGYREIYVERNKIRQTYHSLDRDSFLKGILGSPATLHVLDSQGRHTGINLTTGEHERNILRSFYFSNYTYETNETNETVNKTMPATIILYDVNQEYTFKIIANLTEEQKSSPEVEHFNFTVERQTNDSLTLIFYVNVSLFENTTAILPFNLTTTNFSMEIDYDGDGITDETKSPDFVKVDYMPEAEIISPIDNSTYLYREEITFKGNGTDPEDGDLTNITLVWTSDIDGFIGIGNEFETANLSIGKHNITLRVNDTLGQVNTSTVSIFIRDTQPNMFIDILKEDETPGTEHHTNVVETSADDPCILTVYIKNTGYGILHNVTVFTNVNQTKTVGDITESETTQIPIEFIPTTPGFGSLNITVVADELESNLTRTILVVKFTLIVTLTDAAYNLSDPVPINISITNEVPNMRFIDLSTRINITGSSYSQNFDIPILSLGPLVTKNMSFTWDTTGADSGTYSIVTSLMMANQKITSNTKTISLGTILITDLTNIELLSADSGITSITITRLNLSEINETYKPLWMTPQSAYMINSTGTGNFTLRFTDIQYANHITVYKINETNHWIELNYTTTFDNVTIMMSVEDPPVVFTLLVVSATIDIDPDTLNLNSSGKWITCYIELPEGYNVENINISTILLNDSILAEDHPTNISDYDEDGISDLMVKFDRQEVQDILEPGDNVAITVSGKFFDETIFEGTDYIKAI